MYNFEYCIIVPHEMEQEEMISCGCYDPDTNCEKTASLRNHSRANPLSLQSYISQVLHISRGCLSPKSDMDIQFLVIWAAQGSTGKN